MLWLRISLLLLLWRPFCIFDEILDLLELILDDFLNLLRLEADPKILSHDLSLWTWSPPMTAFLSGVDCKLLVSWMLILRTFSYLILSNSSFSFLMHCAHSRSSLMVSLSTFRLMAWCILLSRSINSYSSSVIKGKLLAKFWLCTDMELYYGFTDDDLKFKFSRKSLSKYGVSKCPLISLCITFSLWSLTDSMLLTEAYELFSFLILVSVILREKSKTWDWLETEWSPSSFLAFVWKWN